MYTLPARLPIQFFITLHAQSAWAIAQRRVDVLGVYNNLNGVQRPLILEVISLFVMLLQQMPCLNSKVDTLSIY